MARRALQNACQKLGANKNDTLAKQLEWLHNKGKITDRVYNQSIVIKQFGNYGAHPQDDGLDSLQDEEAEDVVRICERILRDLYP